MTTDSTLDRIAKLPPRKLALLAAELYERSRAPGTAEPIAITAMACRLPSADTPEALWRFLELGSDAIERLPEERLALAGAAASEIDGRGAAWGSFLRDVDQFDPAAFGISDAEAEGMDPQQRLLLELCWEALENAGAPLDALESATGVFMGVSGVDYALLTQASHAENPYAVTGVANALVAGRISYVFGFNGPSAVVDTACSASASAIHLACQSLRARECAQALAGGINLLLLPQITRKVARLEVLALDGRCKTFSADADGFVRGEGGGVLVLQRLSDALAAQAPILGVIRGSAWNQDGRSGGLTAPSGPAQERVIRAALANAGTTPERVSYLEAHGTGTALGDAIEITALSHVFGGARNEKLALGSVKTNLGHLEAAAGVAGVIKVLLALRNEKIPPSLHAERLTPRIDWERQSLTVATAALPWPRGPRPRLAGVSSFGLSGTNVHLLIGEAPDLEAPRGEEPDLAPGHLPTILTVTAKSQPALAALAARYADALDRRPRVDIAAFAATANLRRAHYLHRLALVVADRADAVSALRRVSRGGDNEAGSDVAPQHRVSRVGIWFGDERPDAALLARLQAEPAFATAQAEWRAALCVANGDATGSTVTTVGYQFALERLWRSWGLRAALLAGHGAGAITAALAAGGLTLADAARLTRARDTGEPPPVIAFHPVAIPLLAGLLDEPAQVGCAPGDDCIVVAEAMRVHARAAAAVDRLITPEIDDDPVLGPIAAAYTAGAAIDWTGFHRGNATDPTLLPNYPFQRKSYWVRLPRRERGSQQESGPGAAELEDALYRIEWAAEPALTRETPTPAAVMAVLQPRLRQLASEHDCAEFGDAQRELAQFAIGCIAAALGQLRPDIKPGAFLDVTELGITPAHRRFAGGLLALMESRGFVGRRGAGWVVAQALPSADLTGELARLRRTYPRFIPEIDVAARATRLGDVLIGRISGVDVLFPDGSFALADAFYRDSLFARVMNAIVGETVAELSRAAGRPLHVLEIGAGTGSTTAAVLSRLPEGAHYTFTDVSSAFLASARRAFTAPGMRFEVLDIESAAGVAALVEAPFDIVVAANVLHATRDLRETLDHVRRLLRPDGALVLYEGTETEPIAEVTFGALDGWWKHEDARSSGPLLDRRRWLEMLASAGFVAACLPEEPDFGGIARQQTVIVARPHATAQAPTPPAAVMLLHRDPAELASAALVDCGLAVRKATGAEFDTALETLDTGPGTAWLYLAGNGEPTVATGQSALVDLLAIAQRLLALGHAAPVLWVVTLGAQPIEAVRHPAHAALWGFGRTLAAEAPGLRTAFVDLSGSELDWRSLARLIASGKTPAEAALYGGRVLTPALVRLPPLAPPRGSVVSRDGCYVVTGAYGVLGAATVRWLAAEGAGKLFLIGRTPPASSALAAVEAARHAGTEVATIIGDVADAATVAALFDLVAADPRPLRGVIHSAAAIRDAPTARQTPASLDEAMRPKADGAWLLHQQTRTHKLDFFVLYSSGAALTGLAGAGNYAAANSFVDALAHLRRAQGLPAVSIDWGLWESSGLTGAEHPVAAWAMLGGRPITAAQGMAILGRIILADVPQVAVLPLDMAALRRSVGSRQPPMLLRRLLGDLPSESGPTVADESLVTEYTTLLAAAAAAEKPSFLVEFIRRRTAELVRLEQGAMIEDNRPLMELGLDSLVGLQLRNDLQSLSGVTFPPTLFFDFPTIGELAGYLELVLPPTEAATPTAERERVLI
jgi:3-oxoacyl-(acyl-carrier-protein) synthase/SAM-dependent methyltransferase/acyl carrier protein